MTSNFLQSWHKHYTPKFASILLIRSQLILLSLVCPQVVLVCVSTINISRLLFCLKVIYLESIFLFAVKAEFLCFKYVLPAR